MSNVFDPRVINRIKGYEVRSHRLIEGFREGMHKSRLRGMSTSFAQHRQYVPGDDTRRLDWKVFAKTERFFIKQYEAETNLCCHIVLDTSKSMFFKSDEALMTKFEYAATLVASLMYLLMDQKDSFGLVLFDRKIRAQFPTRSSASHFRNIADVLEKATPGEASELTDALGILGPQLKRKGLVLVVSDFLTNVDKLSKSLGQLSSLGQDVHLIQIEDPLERDFELSGQTNLLGSENEGQMLCEPSDLQETYLRERAEHFQQIQTAARRFGFAAEIMNTDAPLDAALAALLAARLASTVR
jgi:uncharacterized protein (DUF58 family)